MRALFDFDDTSYRSTLYRIIYSLNATNSINMHSKKTFTAENIVVHEHRFHKMSSSPLSSLLLAEHLSSSSCARHVTDQARGLRAAADGHW